MKSKPHAAPDAPAGEDLPPRLHCEGGQLIKPNGYPITLRGVSFGAVGEDEPADVPAVQAMGANCVRVALRWWTPYGGGIESRDNDGFAFLLRENVARWVDLVSAVAAAGLWSIPFVDSNCGQLGTQDADTMAYCDPRGSWGARGRNFLTDPAMRATFAGVVWPALAARLRTVAKVALLELQPEMVPGWGPEAAPAVRDFYRQVIAGIRPVDADTPFLLGPRDAYNINLCDEAWLSERTDCVYTGNLLNPFVTNAQKFDAGLGALVRMRDERGVPIFVQQLGRKTGDDRNLNHMRRVLDRMDEEQVGAAWWQWKQNTDNPDEYALNFKNPDGFGTWVQKADEIALLTEHWSAQV